MLGLSGIAPALVGQLGTRHQQQELVVKYVTSLPIVQILLVLALVCHPVNLLVGPCTFAKGPVATNLAQEKTCAVAVLVGDNLVDHGADAVLGGRPHNGCVHQVGGVVLPHCYDGLDLRAVILCALAAQGWCVC